MITFLSPYAEEVALDITLRKAKEGTLDRQKEIDFLECEQREEQICKMEVWKIRERFEELLP